MGKTLVGLEDLSKLNTAFYILKESLDSGRLFEFEVVSDSMSPCLKIADKVTVSSVAPELLRLGDIIVYKIGGCLCVHRYIYAPKKQNRLIGLVTKADNCFDFDPYSVSVGQLLGKAVAINRRGKKMKLSNPLWRNINLAIGTLSFLQAFIIKLLRDLKSALPCRNSLGLCKRIIALPFSILIKALTVFAS